MRYGQIVTIRPNVIFNRGASYCAALLFGMRDDLLPPCRSHCPELDWMDSRIRRQRGWVDGLGGDLSNRAGRPVGGPQGHRSRRHLLLPTVPGSEAPLTVRGPRYPAGCAPPA